ncbi:hypothetical protein RI054_39g143980 [Pseudoscourfieldia marina]
MATASMMSRSRPFMGVISLFWAWSLMSSSSSTFSSLERSSFSCFVSATTTHSDSSSAAAAAAASQHQDSSFSLDGPSRHWAAIGAVHEKTHRVGTNDDVLLKKARLAHAAAAQVQNDDELQSDLDDEDADEQPAPMQRPTSPCPERESQLFHVFAASLQATMPGQYAVLYGHERLATKDSILRNADIRWPLRVLVADHADAARAIRALGAHVNCTERFCRQTCLRVDVDATQACVPMNVHFPGDGFFPWRFTDSALREAALLRAHGSDDGQNDDGGGACAVRVASAFHTACAVAYTACVHHAAISKSAHVLLGALEPLSKFGYRADDAYDIRRVCALVATVVRDPHHHDSEPWTLWPPSRPFDDETLPSMPLAFPLAALVRARHIYDDGSRGGDVLSRAFDLRCSSAERAPLALGGGVAAKNWCSRGAPNDLTLPSFAKQAAHGLAGRERAILAHLRDETRLGWPHLTANISGTTNTAPSSSSNIDAMAKGVCGLPPFAQPTGSGGAFVGPDLHAQHFVGDASLDHLEEELERRGKNRMERYKALRIFLLDLVDSLIAMRTLGIKHGDLCPAHVRLVFCHVSDDALPPRYRLLTRLPLHWAPEASASLNIMPSTPELRVQPVLVDFGWATAARFSSELREHPIGESARLKGLRFGLRPPPNADSDAWMIGAALRDALGAFPPALPLADVMQTLPTPPLSAVRRWIERPPPLESIDQASLEDRCEALCSRRLAEGRDADTARDALRPLLLDDVRSNRTIKRCGASSAMAAALDARSRDLAASGRLTQAASIALQSAAVLQEALIEEERKHDDGAGTGATMLNGGGGDAMVNERSRRISTAARELCRAHNNLGVLYTHLDLPLHAKRHLNRAIALDAHCIGASENLEHVTWQHDGVLSLMDSYRSAVPDITARRSRTPPSTAHYPPTGGHDDEL